MSILVDENTRLLVQGITGSEGSFHTRKCIEYGTKVVAGVTPGKGGSDFDGIPVFNEVERAVKETGANVSMIFVPPAFAADAIMEAADAGIPLVVCITDGIPTQDMVTVINYLHGKATRLIGPNCPGLISPGKCKVGLMPGDIHRPGNVGVVSRSGTLTYEAVAQLTEQNIGQSTCIGVGGDPLIGTTFVDVLRLFEKDPQTKLVVLIGEIGGTAEQEAAEVMKKEMTKPIVSFVAGSTAPPGRRMGHAGAIITGSSGTVSEKIAALKAAGAAIASSPAEIGSVARKVLESQT
ncbi:MAG: succinate--CoA ligase subunit alpha [Dehalococcoidia bacterium]|jgi:succinyl-CoA synthetase alpha subunit|nr:succinate--CoA ligase subunit alpha [Chloroflexota bacterium]MCK4242706.1 succinate--CoA ligase subunit alpha [Dehalococcoidia bacterium]